MPESPNARTPFSRREIAVMVGLLVVGELLGVASSYATRSSNAELSKAFAAGSVTLLFGALLGGIVSLLVAELDRRRVRRAAEVEFVSNVLADLKSVYDGVDRGRTLISAHQSVKTYGDEMRAFIEARVKLRNVERALEFDERRRHIMRVRAPVHAMAQYLKSLTEEFESRYNALSRAQSIYEAEMDGARERLKRREPAELPKNTPWEELKRLTVLADFIKPAEPERTVGDDPDRKYPSSYGKEFLAPLDEASRLLRDALAYQLANRSSRLMKNGDAESSWPPPTLRDGSRA